MDRLLDREANQGSWRDRVPLAADNSDAGGDFATDSGRLGALLPPGVDTQTIHLDDLALATAQQQLFQTLKSGGALFNYLGHVGLDRMADEGLLRSTDVSQLPTGSSTPVVTAGAGEVLSVYNLLGEPVLMFE